MTNENQSKTFLSYSRINKDFALKLAKELKSEGFNVWLDQLDIPTGSRWDREVEKALKECKIFMIILTQASVDSENVLDEIGYAIDNGKRILPVLLENCGVPLRLRRFQYVDFTTKSFEDGVDSAKELLKDFIDEISSPIPTTTLPIDNQKKLTSAPAKVKYAPVQKKPMSSWLVIGVVAIVALVIAWVGFRAFLNKRINTPVTEIPVVPVTALPIVVNPPTETPAELPSNLNFEDGCIDSIRWSLLDGNSRIADNNCWSLSDWGMNAENGKGLVVVAKSLKSAVSHGILTSIDQPVVISFDVQVNEITTPSQLDSYMGFGFLPAISSVPKTDGMLYYLVVDKQNAPIYIQLKAPGEDKYYLPVPPAVKLGQVYSFKLEVSGNFLTFYQDNLKIDERSLNGVYNYFWIGYNVPDDGSLSTVISNFSIETR